VKDENGLDQVGDAGGAAAGLAKQPPGLQGGHRLLADPLNVSVDDVVTMDLQENLHGIERQINGIHNAQTPADLPDDEEHDDVPFPMRVIALRRCR
jgi:hypothetical protein